GKKFINDNDIWIKNKFIKELFYSKVLYEHDKFFIVYSQLANVLISLEVGNRNISSNTIKDIIVDKGIFNFKEDVFELLDLMPSTKCKSIDSWINEFKLILSNSNYYLKNELFKELEVVKGDILIDDLFDSETPNNLYNLSTIHKVKGKTFDAVLLILKSGYKSRINDFLNKNIFKEELRNVYVAITRPRKILILATPTDEEEWNKLFFPFDENKGQKSLDSFFN
ncbi:MAG: hypothetical protein MJ209_06275, partial [archaeon]|nr:hypothetical protein [archaeon]